MQDPLKQGLKLIAADGTIVKNCNSNARSIKTRIETIFRIFNSNVIACIRMQDPLKQGLKQDHNNILEA